MNLKEVCFFVDAYGRRFHHGSKTNGRATGAK
jgi:hypothetical protein